MPILLTGYGFPECFIEATSMQLDLFDDNRSTILLNDAAGMLRTLDLEKACAIYDELLKNAPEDGEIRGLKGGVERWRERLLRFSDAGPEGLYEIHSHLVEGTPQALRAGILAFLGEQLLASPAPELIYRPPRFHLGCVLREAGRHAEAEHWFVAALRSGITQRGKFLAWQGDTLTLCGKGAAAMECYQAAFLEDPDSVDIDAFANRDIRALLLTLGLECFDEETDDREALPWLPFWGWLHGNFPLDLNAVTADRTAFAAYLRQAGDGGTLPRARLWYENLRFAEYLRTCFRDDGELVLVRKRMKQLNGEMFARYMKKIGRVNGGAGR
jgi:tetratricopeptide (TPR) repeat protein